MSATTTQEINFAQTVFANPLVVVPGIMDMLSIPEIVAVLDMGVMNRFENHLKAVVEYRCQFAAQRDSDIHAVARRMVASHKAFRLKEEHQRALVASLFAIDLRALRTWERMEGRTATEAELDSFLNGIGGTYDFAGTHKFPLNDWPVPSFEELEDRYVASLPEVVPATSPVGLEKFWHGMSYATMLSCLGLRTTSQLVKFIEEKSNHHLRCDFIAAAPQAR